MFLSELLFARQNADKVLGKLLLNAHRYPTLDMKIVAQQVQALQKIESKIPSWFANESIFYPPSLAIEQCSSEKTACFKANLVAGKHLIDITGGLGVDSSFFAKTVTNITYIEHNDGLATIAKKNFKALGFNNISVQSANSLVWLETNDCSPDWLYVDPHRRNDTQQKVFRLEDCEPNVLTHQDFFLGKAPNILLKLSPMMDLAEAQRLLHHISDIYVVALHNEVKEILIIQRRNYTQEPRIYAINLGKKEDVFSFFNSSEKKIETSYSLPLKYLYEPNAALLKSGAFRNIAHHWHLAKLHKNSHLYTAETLIPAFQGRVFMILNTTAPKDLKRILPSMKANLSTRNFPMTVAELRKKLGLKDGGEHYIFATTNIEDKKILLLCQKVPSE